MGKGGGKAHTPREAKDNLKSTQMMSVIDAIGEGPIEGPVKGLQSILVNKTPLTDTDGNPVIHGVTAVWRAGEQEQTPPEGFESSGAETGLGVEVTKAKPVTRTITSANIDRLRVTFGVQSLVETTSKGDRNPASVRLLIQLQRNGNWVTEKDVTINGKTTSQFLASVILDNLPPRPFNIRMVRETADSTTDQLQNKTLWSSYTEIIDVKQCYPNTAIVGLQVDAEQFGGQQMTVNYHIRGRIIQVPSNYDPEKRTYSGIWDGSLKPAYSNNPAWCLWDMLTHPRYGMGKRLGAADVDKWALYAIGQYCDQTVPDGFGGTEPRMTFNAYLAQQRKAWDVLSDFCSAMRCMPVWNGQTLTFVQDRPSDVVWPYTNSDVVVDDNGVGFRYSFSALKDRHTAVEVNYTDPQNGWQTSTELVEDPEAILRYGRNLLKMDAFGCTSRGQAHRAGLWVIKTELLETQTVDFTLGSQGLRHTPGDIIEICDNDYAGTLTGGRVLSIDAASRTLTLDREVTLPETGTATVNLINGSGKPASVDITAHPAPDRIQVSTLPDGVETYGVWGLSLPSLRRRLFRCVSIRENTDGTFAITAVQHVPEKEAIVDNGARFEPQSGSLNSVIPPAVQHLTVEVSAADGQYLAQAKWDTPRVVKGVRFSLRLTSGKGTDARLVTTAITADTEHRFSGLPLGEYTLTVRAINSCYGMGKRLGAADVDKWALYAIGQYCDQTVPDGFGGTEPRMTFNAYLAQQRKAWDVLSDFCSAMRCMPVWNGQTLTFVQDRPSDVVWPYTNSDVVVDDNGVGFRYSFSALKDRHTAVEVNYTDPQNGWQTSTELVEDPEAILRYGRNLLKMDAFGCTSRGQAHRAGLWVIKTELLETQTVDFTLGSQGLRHTPGDIIEICDNDYAGTLTGGRVLSIDAATRTLTLDREVTLPETGTSAVNLINGSGKPVSVDITAHPAPDRIQVSTLPDGVETYGVWGLSLPSLRRRLFRCVSIRENTDGTFAITAVQHVPEKEAIVDNGARFEPQSGSLNSVIPPAVQHLTVEVSAADGQYLAQAMWWWMITAWDSATASVP
ncbi:phage tail protein [Escherichia coli KTE1]|nr:phage tail protein [Escherichia coli KTE1]